ncbi:MAG: hypothetical protein ACE5EC_07110, partial [Phycisphaerae bacterium]
MNTERYPLPLAYLAVAMLFTPTATSYAWDEDGHAIVTHLAIDALPETMPAWIKTPEIRARLVYLSAEPDRWRGQNSPQVGHATYPDHYIDEELLHPFGLSLKTLPPFRREFTDLMAAQRATAPDKFDPRNTEKDANYTQLSPGMLPYRIVESQGLIAASWTQLKTYEKYRDRVTQSMIDNARRNIVYHMGILSHFAGDGAQPLHLTHHHHGWVGPNPKGYTRESGFHRYIDGDIIRHHAISYDSLMSRRRPARKISTTNEWDAIRAYLYESFEQMDPLYALEKSGKLTGPEGKRFSEDRLMTGGAALAGIWTAA